MNEQFYEGERGHERLVRATLPDGNEAFYEGERGHERKVRTKFSSDAEGLYEGERGHERMVCVTYSDCGYKDFYDGKKDHERLVRATYPNGKEVFYAIHSRSKIEWAGQPTQFTVGRQHAPLHNHMAPWPPRAV
jgi:hypothetical protein